MTETPLPNDPAARTPTGEIKDPAQITTEEKKTPDQTPPEPKGETLLTGKDPEKKEEKAPDPNAKKDDAPKGAPEKYEAFKVADGYEIDPKALEEVSAKFKEMNLSQTQAQDLVDYYAKLSQESLEAPFKAYRDMRQGWQDQVKADPELGPKLDEIKVNIGKAYDALNQPELVKAFKEAMDLTGAGDHPAFIKLFNAFAQAFVEGRHVAGGGPSKAAQTAPGRGQPTAAQAIFPDLPSSQPQRG